MQKGWKSKAGCMGFQIKTESIRRKFKENKNFLKKFKKTRNILLNLITPLFSATLISLFIITKQ